MIYFSGSEAGFCPSSDQTEQNKSVRAEAFTLSSDERMDIVNEGLRLISKKNGLTFGTDAFLLAAFVRSRRVERAVDLGSGTGIVSLLLCQKDKARQVTAVELQPSFADLTARNARFNGLSGRISALAADVRTLNQRDTGGEVGLVVSNPPYMRLGSGRPNAQTERDLARHEVMGGIADFCAAAGRVLRTGGCFCVVWKPERLTELLAAMRENRLEPKRMTLVHADAAREPCAVLVEAVRDAAADLRITPPLLLYTPQVGSSGARTLTPEARRVYDTCEWSFTDRQQKENKKE